MRITNSMTTKAGRLTLGKCLLLASTTVSTTAFAKDTAVAAASDTPQVADIVVTATKRSESLQKVPISVQALTQAKLEQHQVASLDDYIKLLPSVSYQSYGPGQSQIFFRGISTGGDGGYGAHFGSLPTSGLYIDEVPLTTIGNTPDFHVYDIARVEALSGPQGTLFGASSLAGTLRLITNQPDTNKFSAGYDLQGNAYGKGKPGGVAEGFINLPLSDRAALRIVGFYDHEGGYIDNVPATRTYTLGGNNPSNYITIDNHRYAKNGFNTVDTYGGRAALKIDLDDSWTATPSVIYEHQVAHGAFLYDPKVGDLKVHDFEPDINRDQWYQAALTITGKIANVDVLYSGGYFARSVFNETDYSYYTVAYDTGGDVYPNGKGGNLDPSQIFESYDAYTKQTHELRFTTPKDSRLRAIVGAFYQRQTDRTIESFAVPGLGAIPNSPAVPGIYSSHVPLLRDGVFAGNSLIVDRDAAIFTEVAFDILPNLTLTGGVRGYYYRNSRYGFGGSASSAASATCLPTTQQDIPCASINGSAHEYGETHKANISWKIDPNHLVYFTYSTGFRPGGFSTRASVPPYKADTLSNYEIGWKTSWLDHRLTINGSAFMENWDKLQYAISLIGGMGVLSTFNVGNARVKGLEGDVTWRVTPQLTLSSSATYTDAKLTTGFTSSDGDSAPKGTRLPIQPRFKINATARYEFEVGSLKSFVQAAMLHQSGTRTWLTQNEYSFLGPTKQFTTFDFSAGVSRDTWTFEAFVQNAFDNRGQLSINTVCVPSICGFAARIYPVKPQLFGLKIGQRF